MQTVVNWELHTIIPVNTQTSRALGFVKFNMRIAKNVRVYRDIVFPLVLNVNPCFYRPFAVRCFYTTGVVNRAMVPRALQAA
jgi:hypothetical protein